MSQNRSKGKEIMDNLTHLRTPTTEDNRYKRRGLLLIGLAFIAAGIMVAVMTTSQSSWDDVEVDTGSQIETSISDDAESTDSIENTESK